MNITDIQLGDRVTPTGRHVYAIKPATVIAYQRLRYRAKVRFEDGHERWFPVRELRKLLP